MGYVAYPADEPCPRCGNSEDVTAFNKPEGSGVKRCFTCADCPHEWSEYHRQADGIHA